MKGKLKALGFMLLLAILFVFWFLFYGMWYWMFHGKLPEFPLRIA